MNVFDMSSKIEELIESRVEHIVKHETLSSLYDLVDNCINKDGTCIADVIKQIRDNCNNELEHSLGCKELIANLCFLMELLWESGFIKCTSTQFLDSHEDAIEHEVKYETGLSHFEDDSMLNICIHKDIVKKIEPTSLFISFEVDEERIKEL